MKLDKYDWFTNASRRSCISDANERVKQKQYDECWQAVDTSKKRNQDKNIEKREM